jgi:arginine-tRNA-protein transferase
MSTSYLSWAEQSINIADVKAIDTAYASGFVATRIDRGQFQQTRSLRIDLSRFELSSENRRVLKKTEGLTMKSIVLPLADYHWSIGKLGKDFYTEKFGDGTFSANKIKEILTDKDKSNFNAILSFSLDEKVVGYSICLETPNLLHYSYPFYDLSASIPNLGLGMMIRAITYAKEMGKQYVYLGSFQRPTDTYKLQFEGLEWFDGQEWQIDQDVLKKIFLKTN